jgi:hypothetical protein
VNYPRRVIKSGSVRVHDSRRTKRRREERNQGDARANMKSTIPKVRADSTEASISGGERSRSVYDLTNNQKAARAIKAGGNFQKQMRGVDHDPLTCKMKLMTTSEP